MARSYIKPHSLKHYVEECRLRSSAVTLGSVRQTGKRVLCDQPPKPPGAESRFSQKHLLDYFSQCKRQASSDPCDRAAKRSRASQNSAIKGSAIKGFSTPRPSTYAAAHEAQQNPTLLSLPMELQLRIICNLGHHEVGPLLLTCKAMHDVVGVAASIHFRYKTPERDVIPPPNRTKVPQAPRPVRRIMRMMEPMKVDFSSSAGAGQPTVPEGEAGRSDAGPAPERNTSGAPQPHLHSTRVLVFSES
eukprot:jgi/Mesvir1/5181/Mv15316-RA.1